MDNLKDINDFLTERKVTVKRRYTESSPAKNVSTSARVRSSVLEAIADGHITEEEMTKILTELKAHKRWLNRNKTLFNISEDQAGIKTFSLSPYGQRVMNATKTTIINEALSVPYKEQGKKPVNIFVGRFQPFTLGHVKVFEKMYKENGHPVVVYMVRGKKPDPEKRPFDEDLQQAMFAKMKKQYPFLEASYVVPNAAIDTLYSAARPAYEPMMWGYGTDRKKDYSGMINKQAYRDQLDVHPEFKGIEIPRTGENISASKVRNALKIDDEKTFKQLTPKSIHSFYKTLQNTLSPIKENNNTMKNLKSINEFCINEATAVMDATDPKSKVLTKLLKKNKVKMEVIDMKGPSGFPEVELTGSRKDIMTVLSSKDGWDDAGLGEYIEESAINESKKAKAKKPNEVITVDVDLSGNDKDIMDAIKSFNLTAKPNGANRGTGHDLTGKKKDLLGYLQSDYYALEASDIEDMFPELLETSVNEEYVESMDSVEIANALGKIEELWKDWRKGPMTEPSDIKPAQKELKGWIDRWFKQTIK